jgi:hypothetical protein
MDDLCELLQHSAYEGVGYDDALAAWGWSFFDKPL